ncbi:proteasome subunit beta [Nanoarchaeota archaeon]
MADELKTGTTTLALRCKDGVVLAADRRVTAGHMIANKDFDKVYPIEDYMAITTAGTVSDVQLLLKLLKAEIRLKRLRTSRPVTVSEAANLLAGMVYSNIRKFSSIPGISHFLFAGKDHEGHHIYDIFPDGSIAKINDFISSGSGSIFVFGVLETLYKPNMTLDEGKSLAIKAMNASLQRDSASGNGVDIVTIGNDGVYKKVWSTSINTGVKE